jgi:hypothetical protein
MHGSRVTLLLSIDRYANQHSVINIATQGFPTKISRSCQVHVSCQTAHILITINDEPASM